jgi:hypothetical protein
LKEDSVTNPLADLAEFKRPIVQPYPLWFAFLYRAERVITVGRVVGWLPEVEMIPIVAVQREDGSLASIVLVDPMASPENMAMFLGDTRADVLWSARYARGGEDDARHRLPLCPATEVAG